jgi:hypothetical protein
VGIRYADVTADRLKKAGFVDVDTNLEEAPTTLATEADYREFVTTVIYHPHLERLPNRRSSRPSSIASPSWRARAVPFTLDYWRLNMHGEKP